VHIVKQLDTLENGLVVVDMLHTSDELSDLKFSLKSLVKHFCVVFQLDVDVNFIIKDLFLDLVYYLEVGCVHRLLQSGFTVLNFLQARFTAADSFLRDLAGDTFEDLVPDAIFLAEETIAVRAEELCVLECELLAAAVLSSALVLLLTAIDE
jgi:hypothetical protein